MSKSILKIGKAMNFASIEDMIDCSNGVLPYEEARKRYEAMDKTPKGTVVCTGFTDDGVVTFDYKPNETVMTLSELRDGKKK